METTSLYAELIVIGLESFLWITGFCVYFTDIAAIKNVIDIFSSIPISIISLGIMYVVGIVMDRVSDVVFQQLENRCRSESGLKAKTSIIILGKEGRENYFIFSRTKIRILRASVLNLPLIFIAIELNLMKYLECNIGLIYFFFVVGRLMVASSIVGYIQSLKSFYNRARILEEIDQKQEAAHE